MSSRTGIEAVLEPAGIRLVGFSPREPGQPRPLVSTASGDGIHAVVLGRIGYRVDLKGVLGLTRHEVESFSAAELLAQGYRTGGVQFLQRVEGDFALLLLDQRGPGPGRVFARRDPQGAFPLYEARVGETRIVGSSLERVSARLPQRDLNPQFIAEYLVSQGAVSEVGSDECVWRGVRRVRPGVLEEHTAATVRTVSTWDWSAPSSEASRRSREEWAADFRTVLSSAVADRCGEAAVSVHVSGGLDSTTVGYLAHDALAARGQPGPHGIALVFESLPEMRDETAYVDAARRARPGLDVESVVADALRDFSLFDRPCGHDEPYAGLWRGAIDRATVASAVRQGAGILLTGLGGDEILDRCPYHIADALRRGHVWRAWRTATTWAQAFRWNVWNVFYPFGLANVWPVWSRLGAGRMLHQHGQGLASANEWELPEWIAPEFVAACRVRDIAARMIRETFLSHPRQTASVALDAVRRRSGNATGWACAADQNLLIAHPFLDPRVVRLALQWHEQTVPEPGRLKPLLLDATEQLLPREIRERRSKGNWNQPYYAGLRHHVPVLEDLIDSVDLPFDFVSRPVLKETVRRAALGAIAPRPLQFLNATLCLLHWLRYDQPRSCVVRVCDSQLEAGQSVIARSPWGGRASA